MLHGLGRARASGLCSTQCPVLCERATPWLLDVLGVDNFQSMVGRTLRFNQLVKTIDPARNRGQPLNLGGAITSYRWRPAGGVVNAHACDGWTSPAFVVSSNAGEVQGVQLPSPCNAGTHEQQPHGF